MSGQVPLVTSLLVTTSEASAVHASLIVIPRASSAATVVSAAGSEVMEQPSIFTTGSVPVTTGGCVSSTLIVCVMVTVLPQRSVMV